MNVTKLDIPKEILYVLDTLKSKGYKAYIVGGAVRDFLMNKPVSDYDITTDAHPEDVHSLFKKCIDTGISHGTVTVVENGCNIEVTTFRNEGKYTDHRKPDNVSFSKELSEDLKRRDFTVNALCYNPYEGIVDLYNGTEDIKNKILRAVGDAKERFEEDALRMLRLVRFSLKTGFLPHRDTLLAMYQKEHLIHFVSKERIREELIKAITSEYTENLLLFKDSKIMNTIFDTEFYKYISEEVLNNLKSLNEDYLTALAYLMDILYSDSKDIKTFLNNYKFSNKEKKHIISVNTILNTDISYNRSELKHLMRKYDISDIKRAFDILSLNNDLTETKNQIEDIIIKGEPYLISHLKITGNDLKLPGIKDNDIGKCLGYLLEYVIDNPETNKKEILLKKAGEIYEA